eukprot:8959161-Pyramimonas_sp.AAC.3
MGRQGSGPRQVKIKPVKAPTGEPVESNRVLPMALDSLENPRGTLGFRKGTYWKEKGTQAILPHM